MDWHARVSRGIFMEPKLHNENDVLYANNGFADRRSGAQCRRECRDSERSSFHRRIYTTPSLTTTSIDASDYAGYIQDSWRPTPRAHDHAGRARRQRQGARQSLQHPERRTVSRSARASGATYVLTKTRKNVLR